MKKIIIRFFCVLVLAIPVFSKAGPPIPIPKVSAEESIALARQTFTEKIATLQNADYFKNFILISVQYIPMTKEYGSNWIWEIIFAHPKDNDCKWFYQVSDEKVVTLIGTSK